MLRTLTSFQGNAALVEILLSNTENKQKRHMSQHATSTMLMLTTAQLTAPSQLQWIKSDFSFNCFAHCFHNKILSQRLFQVHIRSWKDKFLQLGKSFEVPSFLSLLL